MAYILLPIKAQTECFMVTVITIFLMVVMLILEFMLETATT